MKENNKNDNKNSSNVNELAGNKIRQIKLETLSKRNDDHSQSKTKFRFQNSKFQLPPIKKDPKLRESSAATKNQGKSLIFQKSFGHKKSSINDNERLNNSNVENSPKMSVSLKENNNTINIQNNNNNLNQNQNNLNVINEASPISKTHSRNLEYLKKITEQLKKSKEEKNQELQKPIQSPMERFEKIKSSFQNKNVLGSPGVLGHKKIDIVSIVGNINKDPNNNDIFYYEIHRVGNSCKYVEKCFKRRKQWLPYERENVVITTKEEKGKSKNSLKDSPNNSMKNIIITHPIYNNENNPLPNFIWSNTMNHINFGEFSKHRLAHIRKMTNLFEFHNSICNKLNLFLNLMNFCENNNLDLFRMVPVTFPIKYEDPNYINEKNSFAKIFNNIEKYVSDAPIPKDYKYRNLFELSSKYKPGNKIPFHIPKTHYGGKNMWLIKAINLNRGRCIQISDNIDEIENIIKHFYTGIKRSFIKNLGNEQINEEDAEDIETGLNDDVIKQIIHRKDSKEIKKKNDKNQKNQKNNKLKLPIININSNNTNNKIKNSKLNNNNNTCGDSNLVNSMENILSTNPKTTEEINIFSSQDAVNENKFNKIENKDKPKKKKTKTYQNSTVIIQKYIEKPLCYKGRKCDMRLWVLLSWNFNLYLFKEGHFKATSVAYNINSNNSYVHLTNYSVQKYSENFEKFETGNEISFKDFEVSYDNKINVRNDLIPRIKEIIICTMKSVRSKINRLERKICFEIFGYDFMFDEKNNPYLLEVNNNPGYEISSPLIQMLIPRMIDDAFRLTIDEVFYLNKKSIEELSKNPYKVGGYPDDENMWELLCNIEDDDNSIIKSYAL